MTTSTTFWDALDLDSASPPVVAIVGGGGKTSLLFRLGREARERGRSAVLTGTTRFTTPPPLSDGIERIVWHAADAAERLERSIALGEVAIVHDGSERQARWAPLDPETVDAIATTHGLGLLAVEADGSKMRPFKAPAEHEPVIPRSATHVAAVVGVQVLNAPLVDANVHRAEQIRSIVGDEERVTAEVVARVMADERGARKAIGDRAFSVIVNQADIDPSSALHLAEVIRASGVKRVIVASLRDATAPIRKVISE